MEYTDYKAHYQIDADYIVSPEELPVVQMASEKRRLQTIVQTIKRRPGGHILDIGCGSGWLVEMLGREGGRVVAMDISPVGVQKAKRWVESREQRRKSRDERQKRQGVLPTLDSRLPSAIDSPDRSTTLTLDFIAADIYNLPFSDTSFRWVILSEVMEHLNDPDWALREIHRVLEHGGRVVVTVPHRERIRYTLCIHCNRSTPVNAHLWSFKREEIAVRIGRWGFTIIAVEEISNKILEYFRFPWLTRRTPYLLWRWGDGLLNRFGHGAYLCVVAEKSKNG
jgi:ubiquinone/menaquinone biosynthesis C-methylase UbiE